MFFKVCLLLLAVLLASGDLSVFQRKPQFDGRIVGGFEIDITQVPWQVSLQTRGSHFCGGSIIGDRWILTAAHCIATVQSNPSAIQINSGSNAHTDARSVNVKHVVNHRQFNIRTVDYDFALLKLEEPLKFDETTQSIALPSIEDHFEDGSNCLVTGWGSTQNISESSTRLRGIEVPLVPQEKCNQAYSKFGGVTDRMICAGFDEGGKGVCNGDSGGPLVQFNDLKGGETKLVGIISWGSGCAESSYPGVYARIQAVREWISEVTGI